MKTIHKLNIILFIAVGAVFYLVSKSNNGFGRKATTSVRINSVFSEVKSEKEVDSLVFKKLLPFFKVKRDEFDPNGTLCYLPKDSPEHPQGNAVYCYFDQINDSVSNLRIRIQIENKEWLFYKQCQFLIDGELYEYYPFDVEFDSGNKGDVCEWFDNLINEDNVAIVKALSRANKAKIRIIGRHYNKIITISQEQLKSIGDTLALYTAMGGSV